MLFGPLCLKGLIVAGDAILVIFVEIEIRLRPTVGSGLIILGLEPIFCRSGMGARRWGVRRPGSLSEKSSVSIDIAEPLCFFCHKQRNLGGALSKHSGEL